MRKKTPFDKEKAYYFRRQGVITGGGCSVQITPSDVVECYEEVIPVKEFEDGIRDRGAHMHFAGKKEGTATVTVKYFYPTCRPEEFTFTLNVEKNLYVTLGLYPEKRTLKENTPCCRIKTTTGG